MTNNRKYLALLISAATLATSLVVMWQAVRFYHGEVGAPIVDQVSAQMKIDFFHSAFTVKNGSGLGEVFVWLGRAYYYLMGVAVWCGIAGVVSSLGSATARIVEVGFKQYMVECREAEIERNRLMKIESDRERRRELRQKRIEKLQPKASFGFGSLLLGFIIGSIL